LFGGFLMRNRIKLLKHFKIQTVLDVGANSGQYAYYLRRLGYRNRIISFEPLNAAFTMMEKFARRDKKWDVVNIALGDENGFQEINVAGNSVSSSLLDMTNVHLNAEPDSEFCGKERIEIKTLDTFVNESNLSLNNAYMKIDTQGFEKNVIDGAKESLKDIQGLQLELSMVELYQGETLVTEMINYIESKGFTLYSLEPGFYDTKSGQLLQVDGIFYRQPK
jgi:FkbM family methyltransferase